MKRQGQEAGFTLIEVVVAIAILAMAITSLLMFRTGAMIDAAEARNWRVAREIAQEIFSELKAGSRENPPEFGDTSRHELQNYPGFSYSIVLGEDYIATLEGDLEGQKGTEEGESLADLRQWQQERDDLRAARKSGVSYLEYQENQLQLEEERLEKENEAPSEDELEDIAVFVFFPNLRQDSPSDTSHFVLKARISTMAIHGLTPEEAESMAEASGSGSTSTGQGSGALTGGSEGR